jgi:predicted DNA-binding protein YlxM (UPF0122 family)
VRFDRQDLHDEIRTGRLLLDDFDAKILAILNKSLFKSMRSIAERFRVSHATVLNHLHLSIGLKSFHLHLVPHLLIEDLRQNGKTMHAPCCRYCMLSSMMTGSIL